MSGKINILQWIDPTIGMVKLKWLGHAAWMVEFSKEKVLIDPFLTQNPKAAMNPQPLRSCWRRIRYFKKDWRKDRRNVRAFPEGRRSRVE
ncbi:MBL fold metallo-hydrolase [Thermoplasmatales archaeon AK]|nr:MBL fold metallo-hydrolase [Thermoplasmatales archaeon AK]